MKILQKKYLFVLGAFCFSLSTNSQSPYEKVTPKEDTFELLPLGSIIPQGWIRSEVKRDLDGMIGNLDKLLPHIISDDDIFGKDRIRMISGTKGKQNISRPLARSWWNCESQGNWFDGYVRSTLLLNDAVHKERVDSLVNHILSTQDKDGYIGIYGPKLRYNHQYDNAELWAKATVMRALLGYYEATLREDVLEGIKRAVDETMDSYNEKNPPFSKISYHDRNRYGGISHGLIFTDVLERLSQLTNNQKYMDYAAFLYEDYSKAGNFGMRDVKLDNILNPSWKIFDHGVHIYQHIRPLAVSYYATGNPILGKALDIYLDRLDSLITPAGGPSGDEDVLGREMDPSEMGYEYCSIHEVTDSWSTMLRKSGNTAFGDRIERTYFNAAMGAKHPTEPGICYLKFDNCYSLVGTPKLNGLREHEQTSYRYSPTHEDAAVCCVPMAGRISPYFVRSMFMKSNKGVVATLLGPCTLSTKVNGVNVTINEETNYPFSNTIKFTVKVDKPVKFAFNIRKPAWVKSFKLNGNYTEQNNYIVVDRQWNGSIDLNLDFGADYQVCVTNHGEYYFTCGALVFAVPIEGIALKTKEFRVKNMHEINYYPVNFVEYYSPGKVHENTSVIRDKKTTNGIFNSIRINTLLINSQTGRLEKVTLYPVGSTILRQVTYKSATACDQPIAVGFGK